MFGGKEIQDELSLNMYDFHARQQDPIIGRFTSIDPKTEKYYSFSRYNYCINNPLKYIDPTGEDAWLVNPKKNTVILSRNDDYSNIHIIEGLLLVVKIQI